MKKISNKFLLIGFVIMISLCVNRLNAQTPADDPGIGGPGAGAAPAGDGSPVVPFDSSLSLMLLASGLGYVIKSKNNLFARS